MNRFVVTAAAILAVAGLAGAASQAAPPTLSPLDRHYMKSSAAGDHFEIQGGKLAQAKGASAAVKKLGARLVKDHSKSLKELQKVAAKLHVTLPASPEPPMQWELK